MIALSLFGVVACSDDGSEVLKESPIENETPNDETPSNDDYENPDTEIPQEQPDQSPDEPGSTDEPTLPVSGTSSIARSYSTGAGQWKSFREYEYLPDGKVSKVSWITHTPNERKGFNTYHYDGELIKKIVTEYGDETIFLWENGRIVRSENHSVGVLKNYTLYAYDDRGNVGATEIYHRQSNGGYLLSFTTVYLYFQDGNVYKALTYTPSATEGEDPILLKTQTYEGYSSAPNPFPMVNILPNIKAQKNLPTSYRHEANGVELQYSLSYEFREDGYPLQRTVSGAGASETTTYQYY